MKVIVNGQPHEVRAATLAEVIEELDLNRPAVATALNEVFIPIAKRCEHQLKDGDRVEVLSPRQGG